MPARIPRGRTQEAVPAAPPGRVAPVLCLAPGAPARRSALAAMLHAAQSLRSRAALHRAAPALHRAFADAAAPTGFVTAAQARPCTLSTK